MIQNMFSKHLLKQFIISQNLRQITRKMITSNGCLCMSSANHQTIDPEESKVEDMNKKLNSLKGNQNIFKIDLNDRQVVDILTKRPINALDERPDPELLDQMSPSMGLSFNLSAFANECESLQMLIKLGVDLSYIEKNSPNVAEYILKLDFETDIKPYLIFLTDLGVNPENLSYILTKNPLILAQHIDDLNVRINYLRSKHFSPESIASIITKAPKWLNNKTKTIDSNLGLIQKEFALSGHQIREAINNYPRIALMKDMSYRVLNL